MSNPYQHGSSGFHGDSSSNLPTGLPGFGQRSSSSPYAPVASGAIVFPRTGSFAHLLNPVSDGADGPVYLSSSSQTRDADPFRNGADQNGVTSRLPGSRHPHLPSFSRDFERFTRGPPLDGVGSTFGTNTGFFTPSYLRGSTYVQRLEDQYKARLLAQKDGPGAGGLRSQAGSDALRSRGSSLSLQGGSRLTQTVYRGAMGPEGVDEASPLDDDGSLNPLPSRWNKGDKAISLDVLGDGLDVKYVGVRSQGDRDHDTCAIRADRCMPPQCGMYYFEVTVISRKRDDTTICIGFSDKSVALSRPPGWEPNSWGYHGDDGHVFASQNVGKAYGPTFTAGDVVGCGVNFHTGEAFYTKNGDHLGVAFRDVKGSKLKLFPTVGLKKTGDHIRVNFGQTPFVYDIDGMMKREIASINKQISETSTANLAPPMKETDLIQQLVLQFLQHDGYVETARAFAEEVRSQKQALSIDPHSEVEGINITDDEDANNRQRIRRAVLEGDIDKALKQTKAFYPQVIKENEPVHFRLRCRKFIEMIRREAELKMTGTDRRGHGPQQAMEIDDMEMEDGMDSSHESRSLVEEAITYGQNLYAEYSDDPRNEVRKALDDIFSLIAYENPLKEKEVAHLLDRKGRVAVAEELNSAILQSLGKSSRAALENLYAQTSVLLEDLREEGGPGSFVTIQGIVDQIPKSQPF